MTSEQQETDVADWPVVLSLGESWRWWPPLPVPPCGSDLRTMVVSQTMARFIKPMLLLRTRHLPEGANLQYEVFLPI